jgi:hypothetical protein
MKYFKLSLLLLSAVFFITSCDRLPSDETTYSNPNNYVIDDSIGIYDENDARWARENLDLRAVGKVLERSHNAEEFEYLLNSRDGVDNLDLNGDNYVDYISVREYDDRYDNQRGFSLYTMYGTDLIQEIATIVFDRDGYNNYPGSRVLIVGNDEIYGDNCYYETNWRDRNVPIVTWVFDDRDYYYHSPYYDDYYPSNYQAYEVVDTPVYISRVREYYPAPDFVQTNQPTVAEVRIASPYREKSVNQVYARLAKPTQAQVEFQQKDPKFKEFVKNEKVRDRQARVNNGGNFERDNFDKGRRDNPNQFEKADKHQERAEKFNNDQSQMRERSDKSERGNGQGQQKFERENQPKFERQNQPQFERSNSPKAERQNQPKFERQSSPKVERQNQPKFERQNQPKVERQNQPKVERQNQPRVERQNSPKMERPNMKQPQPQVQAQPKGNGNPHGGGKPQGNPNGGGGKPQGNGGGKGKIKP